MINKQTLSNYYIDKKMSMNDVARVLGCSVNKIDYWMRAYDIPRRSRSDAVYSMHNPGGDPFKIKENLSADELYLKGLGVGIFWGEGNKRSKNSLRMGNTDSMLIRTYLEFLRNICGVDESKIRLGLQLFTDTQPFVALDYWMKELGVNKNQFMPTISLIQSGKIGTYKIKNQYGVLTVYVNNTKLRDWMIEQLQTPG